MGSGQLLPDDMRGFIDNRELGVGGLRRVLLEKDKALSKLLDLHIALMRKDPHWGTPPLYQNGKVSIKRLTDRLDEMAGDEGLDEIWRAEAGRNGQPASKTKAKEIGDYLSRDLVRSILKGCKLNTDKKIHVRRSVK